MKKQGNRLMAAAGVLCAVFCAVSLLSCASSGAASGGTANDTNAAVAEQGEGTPGAFSWGSFNDANNGGSSRITMKEDFETINDEIYATYAISGEITNQYEYGYAGWYATPDEETLQRMTTASSFSFKVLGDGQTYQVMFCTGDITDSAHYGTTFTTKKDQVTTVNIKINALRQPADWGEKKPFNQAAATQIQWQTTNNGKPGTFNLKVWDLRIN